MEDLQYAATARGAKCSTCGSRGDGVETMEGLGAELAVNSTPGRVTRSRRPHPAHNEDTRSPRPDSHVWRLPRPHRAEPRRSASSAPAPAQPWRVAGISARNISAALTRLLTSSALPSPSFMKIELMCFSTAWLDGEERLCNRHVALALSDLGQHLALAWRQLSEWRARRTRAPEDEYVDDLRINRRSPCGHRANR